MAYESQGGTWREMITKETFVKALQLIQEQQEINHQFAKALDLVGDGHYVFGVNNKFYDAAMLVLKEAVNDKYDYISWWLYEGEPDYKVWSSDNTEEWNLTEPEALYVSTFYQEGGSPEFDDGIKAWLNEDSTAMTNNGGNDTIAAVTAMGYDAYYVALEALKAAGSTDPAAVKAALPGVTYTGVTGDIAFDDIGDAIRDTAYIKVADTANNAWALETMQKAG